MSFLTCSYRIRQKVGGQVHTMDPSPKKVGGPLTPLTPWLRGLCLRLGSKGRYGSCVCGWQVKLCDTLVTRKPHLSALEIKGLCIKHYEGSHYILVLKFKDFSRTVKDPEVAFSRSNSRRKFTAWTVLQQYLMSVSVITGQF